MTPRQLEAERLAGRLGELVDAPVRIRWAPELAEQRLAGRTRRAAPDVLEVDPGLTGRRLLEVIAHEFAHSIEFRGLVPKRPRVGVRCTFLAEPFGQAIAPLAARGGPTRVELATVLYALGVSLPRPLLRTPGRA